MRETQPIPANVGHYFNYMTRLGRISMAEKRPETSKSPIPVVIAPGFGETPNVFATSLEVLAQAGRTAYTFSHPRWTNADFDLQPQMFPHAEAQKAATLMAVLDAMMIPKCDVIAHSEGALNAVIAAYEAPHRFRNIILVNPAGMIGDDKLPYLLGRFAKKVAGSLAQGYIDRTVIRPVLNAQIEGAKYILKNPIRSIREARDIANMQIGPMLESIHNFGIGIVIIHSTNDHAFPMLRMQNVAQNNYYLDGFLSVYGRHDDMHLYPEKYIRAAEEILTNLEERQTKIQR